MVIITHNHHRTFDPSMISDALFVLVSRGRDSVCGCPIFCAGPSITCGNGPFLPDELHDLITLEEYSDLVHSLDDIFRRTHWPMMPLLFFACCLDVCAAAVCINQRRMHVHHLLDTINQKLAERGLHWQPLDCDGYIAKLCVNRNARQAYLARNGLTVDYPTSLSTHHTPSPSPPPYVPAAAAAVAVKSPSPAPVHNHSRNNSNVDVYIGGEPAPAPAPVTRTHSSVQNKQPSPGNSNYNLTASALAARNGPSRENSNHQQLEERAMVKKRSGEAPMALAPVSNSHNSTAHSSAHSTPTPTGGHTPLGTLVSYASSHNYQDVNADDSGDVNYDTRGVEMNRAASYSNRPASNSNMVSRGAPGGRDVNDYYYGGPSSSTNTGGASPPARESSYHRVGSSGNNKPSQSYDNRY